MNSGSFYNFGKISAMEGKRGRDESHTIQSTKQKKAGRDKTSTPKKKKVTKRKQPET